MNNKKVVVRRGSMVDKAIQAVKIAAFILVLIGIGIEL